MRYLRRLFVPLLGLLALLGVGLFFADRLLARGIATAGTHILGTPTHVEEVELAPFSGRLRLAGLRVANPPGFRGADLFRLDQASLEVSLATLLSDEIVAPRLELRGVRLHIERGPGGMNYAGVLERLGESPSPTDGTGPEGQGPSGPEPRPRFVFEEIALEDIEATLDLLGRGEASTARVRIPEIVLDGVGREPLSAAQLAQLLLTSLLRATLQYADGLPTELVVALRGDLEARGFEFAEGLLQEVDEGLEDLTGGLPPEARQAVEGAVEEAKKGLEEGLQGLFGRKKP